MTKKKIRLGVVGAGGFARFAVNEFAKNEDVCVAAVYDSNQSNAEWMCSILSGAALSESFESLVNSPEIDLVYIATPPHLHYCQSKEALLHDKHVICEKPAAISLKHAQELCTIALQRKLLFVVNLMQRYNPLYAAVRQLQEQKPLGRFLHGYFENYASDEQLTEDHWFWNEAQSGGIFIEHGVHFFDMFNGWLGEGKVVSSQKLLRPGTSAIWDRVQATVQYEEGLVNFYHGFDQPKILDRQELRLQFERGEITLFEWVPTQMKLNAVCSDEEVLILKNIFPHTDLHVMERFNPGRIFKGRFKTIRVNQRIKMATIKPPEKLSLYQQLVQSMLKDQLNWLSQRKHRRVVDHHNAVSSLRLAVDAERNALILK